MKIVVFEGVDRSGKDTMIERVAGKLRENGLTVGVYRNPDAPVRKMLLDPENDLNEKESLLCFYAGYVYTHRKIERERPDVALVNRHVLSALIYQKYGVGIQKSDLFLLNSYIEIPFISHYFFLNLSTEELMKRCIDLPLLAEKYEESESALLERRKSYMALLATIKSDKILRNLFSFDNITELLNNNLIDLENNVTYIVEKIMSYE